MKYNFKKSAREFKVGIRNQITIKDYGTIQLDADEMVTFLTEKGGEYDVARKKWGFYATPSLNGRLKNQGFKSALVKNAKGMFYIMLVEKDKISLFQEYLNEEKNEVVYWLDEME